MGFVLKRSASVDVGSEVKEMIGTESGVLLRPP
jgi:hypothetical protein